MHILAVVCALVFGAQSPAPSSPPSGAALAGTWTLNKEQSDSPRNRADDGRDGDREAGRRGGYGGGRGGFGGRGGYGGRGMGRGGGMRGDANPEASARMRDAMRDIVEPSDRLTIVQTDSMILVTGADGRTTRLAPDGKKIKDENTGVERKTRWDAGKLVSEITGIGPGKMTQTFVVDPETRQLHVVVQTEAGRSRQPRTITHVYDKAE